MTYQVRIERPAQKALARIARPDQDRIIERIESLADEPRPSGVGKLTGRDAWRIRIGNYRVIYEIDDDCLVVLVVQIGHRGSVYR